MAIKLEDNKDLKTSVSIEQTESDTLNPSGDKPQKKTCDNNFFKSPQQHQALNFINLPQHNYDDTSSLSTNCPQAIVCTRLGSGGCSTLSRVPSQRMKK
jgi:hypothetical protein